MADENIPPSPESTNAANEYSEALKKITKEASILKAALKDVTKETKEQFTALVKNGQITKEVAEDIQFYLKAELDLEEARARGKTDLQEETEMLALAKESLAAHGDEVVKFTESLKNQAEAQAKANFATKLGQVAVKAFGSTLSFAGLEAYNLTGGLGSMASQLKAVGLQFDELSKSVQVQTGLGTQSAEVSKQMVVEGAALGMTLEDANAAQVSLNAGFKEFGLLGRDAQLALSNQVVEMERLGVSSEASARAMDLFRFSMGGTTDSTKDLLPELDALAVGLGLPTGQVIDDFNTLGPQLARFGGDARGKFKALATQARSLGLNIQDAFNIAESLDTFEGAADMAGKLNAQLGLQLNSTQLLAADHEGRIALMRQEFSERGKNFSTMHRREQQAVAEMMGVDVDVASKLFGDPMKFDEIDAKRAAAAERSKQLTTAQQKLAAAGERFMIAIEPMATMVMNFAVGLADVLVAIYPVTVAFGVLASLVASLAAGFALYTTLQGLYLVMAKKESIANALKIIMNKGVAESTDKLNESVDDLEKTNKKGGGGFKRLAENAKDLSKPLLALGGAVLMIGGGIYIAATGVAELVQAFAGLGPAATSAAIGIGLLIIPFTAFMAVAAIAVYTGVGPAVAGVLLAIGGGAFALGVGIGLAAAGMALFVHTLKGLAGKDFASAIELLGTLPELFLSIGAAGFLLAFAVKPLMLVGIAIGGIGLGIGLVASRFDSLAESMLRVVDASKAISANTAGLEAIEKIITVSTKVTPAEMENMERVMGAVVKVGETAKASEASGLDRLASAITNMFTGGGADDANNKTIVLKVDERKLGEVVVNVLNDSYGMNIAR